MGVATGRITRLMVCMPPRHGKSELISRFFPAWYLGNYPDRRIILASYEANFASSWGEKARDAFAEASALRWWEHKLNRQATSDWSIAGREGGMVTTGVGGALTGRGGNLILDDPVKNSEEASSPVYRAKAWDWYNSTFATRLEPGCFQIVVMTRWHPDDLGGRILANAEEPWEVINLPAIAEDEDDAIGRAVGEALWPARYDVAALDLMRRERGSYWWAAMYQQRPAPREGGIFKRAWFDGKIIDALPAEARVEKRVRYWDKAATEGGGDWTAGVRASIAGGVVYIEDVKRGQWSSGTVQTTVQTTAAEDTRETIIGMEQEPGSAGKDVKVTYTRMLQGYAFKCEPATGSKAVRADGLATQCEAGNVYLVRGPWNADFIDELCAFRGDTSDVDDQVDGASGAFGLLTSGQGGGPARLIRLRTE